MQPRGRVVARRGAADQSGLPRGGVGENGVDVERRERRAVRELGRRAHCTEQQPVAHEGKQVHEDVFGRDALYVAEEIFMTGTAAEITPVREVDHRLVGDPGPVTRAVQETYAAGVRGRVGWMRPFITSY